MGRYIEERIRTFSLLKSDTNYIFQKPGATTDIKMKFERNKMTFIWVRKN